MVLAPDVALASNEALSALSALSASRSSCASVRSAYLRESRGSCVVTQNLAEWSSACMLMAMARLLGEEADRIDEE